MDQKKTTNKINLQANIKSAYYLKDKLTNQKLVFADAQKAYIYLKSYINSIKDESDIIVFNDQTLEVIINTMNRTLPLDRYVHISPANININDLTSNLYRQ